MILSNSDFPTSLREGRARGVRERLYQIEAQWAIQVFRTALDCQSPVIPEGLAGVLELVYYQ